MKKHTRRPRPEYESLYHRKLSEGLTYETLAADCDVPVSTLQYWFRRFKAERFASDHPNDRGDAAFVRIDIEEPETSCVEVILRDTVRLRVRPGFDEQTVRRLLQLLAC